MSIDSTNKKTTTSAPNSTATKGYKLENNTDDERNIISIHPIKVPTSTTKRPVKEVDGIFEPIVPDESPYYINIGPLISTMETLIPNDSPINSYGVGKYTEPWSVSQNITLVCQISHDCPGATLCINGQCMKPCEGLSSIGNCFSGINESDYCK